MKSLVEFDIHRCLDLLEDENQVFSQDERNVITGAIRYKLSTAEGYISKSREALEKAKGTRNRGKIQEEIENALIQLEFVEDFLINSKY